MGSLGQMLPKEELILFSAGRLQRDSEQAWRVSEIEFLALSFSSEIPHQDTRRA